MPESVTRLWDLVLQSAGHLSTGELVLRAALVCCSLFATVQLLSMCWTHYGDHNATSKSFFLSLLLHCCLGLGWATVVESPPRDFAAPGTPDKPAVRVTLAGEYDSSAGAGSSSRLAWNSSTQPFDAKVARLQRPEQEPSPVETPQVEKAPTLDPILPETPDLPARPEAPMPSPAQQSVASAAVTSPARPSSDIEQPVPEARPESQTQSAASRQA